MNDEGLVAFDGGLDMGAETLALPVKIPDQTKIIQASFTNRNDFWVLRQANQFSLSRLCFHFVIGMNPDRGV